MEGSMADLLTLARTGDNNDGLGGMGLWGFILIFFILTMSGGSWMGRDASGALTRAELNEGFNNQTVISKLDGITNGISDATFSLNNTMINGFNNVNNGICDLGYRLQSCCCETNRNIDSLRYEMSKGFCDVVHAGEKNTQAILDKLCSSEVADLRDRLQFANQTLANQTLANNIVSQVRPTANPAYIVPSPYCAYGAGYNTGCCANI